MSQPIRLATIDDIPSMKAIRDNVRENALFKRSIEAADYVQAITVDGRAWVWIDEGEVVGFACGRVPQHDVWALFVRETHEGRGIGNALMAELEAWMFEQGVTRIELTTDGSTRAERLYRRRGWYMEGRLSNGELRFSKVSPSALI